MRSQTRHLRYEEWGQNPPTRVLAANQAAPGSLGLSFRNIIEGLDRKMSENNKF